MYRRGRAPKSGIRRLDDQPASRIGAITQGILCCTALWRGNQAASRFLAFAQVNMHAAETKTFRYAADRGYASDITLMKHAKPCVVPVRVHGADDTSFTHCGLQQLSGEVSGVSTLNVCVDSRVQRQ